MPPIQTLALVAGVCFFLHGGTPTIASRLTMREPSLKALLRSLVPHQDQQVRIIDVAPRDGLQNESGSIPTAQKLELIERLALTGVDAIEVTSFVSPKWIPQLGDAADIIAKLPSMEERLASRASLPPCIALVPNLKGLEALEACERAAQSRRNSPKSKPIIDSIAVFTAASETFSQRNTNASIAQTIERFHAVVQKPRSAPHLRGYLSCVIACPFEGPIAPRKVADVAAQLVELGITELDLGDTIGAGTPETVLSLLRAVGDRIGPSWFDRHAVTLHFHDTFGRAADCVRASLDFGVRSFDGSVAGLGGCPYASTPTRRAPGNISTELLVRTIRGAGYHCNVDDARLAEASAFAREIVSRSRALA